MTNEVKQRAVLIAASILTIYGIYFASTNISKTNLLGSKSKVVKPTLEAQILTVSEKLPPNEDTDGDGTPNWQETILGTNPEVKDKPLTGGTLSSEDTTKRLADSGNMTVALAKNNATLSSYLNTLAPEDKANIDQRGLAEDTLTATASTFSFKTYSESNLKHILIVPTQADRKVYGNTLAKKTAEMLSAYVSTNDILALKDITDGKEATPNVTKLMKKASATEAFRDFLLTMPVPKDATKTHLIYVGAVSAYAEVMNGFLAEKEDPLKAGLFLRGYKGIVTNMFTTFAGFESYFSDAHLVFTSKEPGYVFTVGFTKK